MTDRELVRQDMEALYLGNLGTVEFDLELPHRGKNGSAIRWHSDHPAFLDEKGHVTRPAFGRGNREVTLTARFTHGDCTEEKSYRVTVLEANNLIEVAEIYPISVSAVRGEPAYLPSASAVRTRDGRVITQFLEWDGGLEHRWDQSGLFSVHGKVRGTQIPVTGQVRVTDAPETSTVPQKLAEHCGGSAVLLEGSDFYAAQERMHRYLLGTDPDQWLCNFRRAAGLPDRGAPEMTGWDSPQGLLRGHSTGHYLSSLALCFRATGDEAIRARAAYMVDALGECQDAFAAQEGYHPGFLSAYSEEQFDLLEAYTPYPRIWAPYYTLHKLLSGLLDLYKLAGLDRALEIAEGIGNWVHARLSRLDHTRRVKMWSIYIAGEYGGMNEALAELYRLTGKQAYLEAARYFDNDRLLYPLSQGVDALDGMHANQHIPQVVGAVKLYEVTGERRYYESAERFWREAVGSHMYAVGGVGESEMFHEPGSIARLLTKSTTESCASYNMLKLTAALYQYRPDAAYMDYYERTVTNHILSSCDHRPTGGSTYFLSMRPRAVKDFDLTENSCCHGTGLESHFKYAENIYFTGEDCVYINLFIPSRLRLENDGLTLTLQTGESDPGAVRITVEADRGLCRELRVRCPCWAEGRADVRVDGAPYAAPLRGGYLVIRREWQGRSEVTVEFPCVLRYEPSPDRPDRFTVHYGPYVLAALTESPQRLRLAREDPEAAFARDPDRPLAFRCRENGVRFIPLEKVWREEHQVYLARP